MPYHNFLKNKIDKLLNSMIERNELESHSGSFNYSIEKITNPKFGQISTNVLMINSKKTKMQLDDFEAKFIKYFSKFNEFKDVKIVKPGFLNFTFTNAYWRKLLEEILQKDQKIRKKDFIKKKVNIEYVSANPTGLMHIGHARGAVLGDTIANLLVEAGYLVDREYYINDAGNQIEILFDSVKYYYLKNKNIQVSEPGEFYSGTYINNISKKLIKQDFNLDLKIDSDDIKKFIIDEILNDIKEDLKKLDIKHNLFTSEKEIITKQNVEIVIEDLKKKNLVYEGYLDQPKGKISDDWKSEKQTLFKSKDIGDDVDRTLIKPNGDITYFMSDIVYHNDKIKRNYDILINIWGVDHAGYVKRIQNAVKSINKKDVQFKIQLTSLVNLIENNEPYKMSKRKGKYVTLRDVIKDVGKDAIRFMMISRSPEKVIDFDFQLVKQQNKDNPVFYVKYAHARCCSIEEMIAFRCPEINEIARCFELLKLPEEIDIIIRLSNYTNVLNQTVKNFEPHRLTNFLYDLSKAFHSYYSKGSESKEKRIIQEENMNLTIARLGLVKAVRKIIYNGLKILKINAPLKM